MNDATQEQTHPLFENAAEIFKARQILGPKNERLRKSSANPALFRESPYSYEQAVFECWLGLKERQWLDQKQITQEDLEAIRTVLSWILGLTSKQIEVERMRGRNLPPLFVDVQTKGTIEERLKNLTEEKLQDKSFFTGILAFFTGLVIKMNTEGLLANSISLLSESFRQSLTARD